MLVAIDVRNRVVTLGVHDGSGWEEVCRFGALAGRTADEYAFLFGTLRLPGMEEPDSIWISSVVPALTPIVAAAAEAVFGRRPSIVGPGVKTGIKIRTENPQEVGSDLVCMAAAGRELTGHAFIVVDFGLALSFSAVNTAGEFLGAAIAPGPELAAESLKEGAALIPEVKLELPETSIGTSTGGSVRSGILLGYRGLVAGLLGDMSLELRAKGAGNIDIFGTGSEIGRILLPTRPECRFVPDLVLEGLLHLSSLNSGLRSPSPPGGITRRGIA